MDDTIPSNTMSPNDFLQFISELRRATQNKNSEVGKVRALHARFEKAGGNKRSLALYEKLATLEPEDAESLLVTALNYCRWTKLAIGAQPDLFALSATAPVPSQEALGRLAETEAFNEGHKAGMAGRSGTEHRFPAGSALAQQFLKGWNDGQETLAQTWCIPLDPTGLPIKPPKKEKAAPKPKKGASAAPTAAPRGRGRRAGASSVN